MADFSNRGSSIPAPGAPTPGAGGSGGCGLSFAAALGTMASFLGVFAFATGITSLAELWDELKRRVDTPIGVSPSISETSSHENQKIEDVDRQQVVLFSDDFDDGTLDAERWSWYGKTVREIDRQLHVDCAVTDQGGGTSTRFFRIARTGLITLTRRARVFASNQFFDGTLRFELGEVEENQFGISYANYKATVPGECSASGFAIFRRGANGHWCESQVAHLSPRIPAIWGTWFDEKFEWDPATGAGAYYINGKLRLTMDVGALPAGVDRLRVRIGTWGWWTGHYQHSDDVRVTQQAP